MNQPALWTEPHWTDAWTVGDRVRRVGSVRGSGTVTAIDPGHTITVSWSDHPHWGAHVTTYGWDGTLEREAA